MEDVVELPFELRSPMLVERPKGSGAFVRLSDDYRKSVVYLGHAKPGTDNEITPLGTGFLVHMGVPMGGYIVTAGHVARDYLDGVPFDIRLNQKKSYGGGGLVAHYDGAKWFYHPTDKTVDIAVMPFEPPEWADVVWFPYKHFASDFKLQSKDIGTGDIAYVVGLLHFMQGKTKNMPTVYTGHIAMMPDGEKIPVIDWRDQKSEKAIQIEAYLVEANALPGSSGSPVFVRRSLKEKLVLPSVQPGPINAWMYGSVWLLGIWRGAWFGEATDGLNLPNKHAKVPVGIGTVVPSRCLIEVLNQADLKTMREDAKNAEDLARAPEALSLPKSAHDGDEILRNMLNMPPKPLTKSKAKPKRKRPA